MLHYYAKKFFAPVIIVPEMTSKNGVDVYIVSDLLKDVHCELTVSFYSWDSFEPKSVLSHQEEVVISQVTFINNGFQLHMLLFLTDNVKQLNLHQIFISQLIESKWL